MFDISNLLLLKTASNNNQYNHNYIIHKKQKHKRSYVQLVNIVENSVQGTFQDLLDKISICCINIQSLDSSIQNSQSSLKGSGSLFVTFTDCTIAGKFIKDVNEKKIQSNEKIKTENWSASFAHPDPTDYDFQSYSKSTTFVTLRVVFGIVVQVFSIAITFSIYFYTSLLKSGSYIFQFFLFALDFVYGKGTFQLINYDSLAFQFFIYSAVIIAFEYLPSIIYLMSKLLLNVVSQLEKYRRYSITSASQWIKGLLFSIAMFFSLMWFVIDKFDFIIENVIAMEKTCTTIPKTTRRVTKVVDFE